MSAAIMDDTAHPRKGASTGRETRPWFKLWARDFLGSGKFGRMDAEERGAYLTLLLRSWAEDGHVLDRDDLADELDVTPERVDEILAGRVGRCFYTDDEGKLRSPRLEQERAEALALTEKRAAAGARGGKANPSKRKQAEANPSKPKQVQAIASDPAAIASVSEAIAKQTEANGSKPKPPVSASVSVSASEGRQAPEESPTAEKRPRARRARLSEGELREMCRAGGLTMELTATVLEYRAHRIESRVRALTPGSWERQIRAALAEPEVFTRAVETTIRNGWQGLQLDAARRELRCAVPGAPRATGRTAVQTSNTEAARRFVANAESGAPPPQLLDGPNPPREVL